MEVLAAIFIIAGGALLRGWVLSILWGWFFVPTLGLPELSVAQAIGVGLLINFLTARVSDLRCSAKDALVHLFIQPAVALSLGLFVRSFM